MTAKNTQIKPYPLGAHCEGDGIRFSFVSTKDSCGIIIYDKKTKQKLEKIPFTSEQKIGNVYCKYLEKYDPSEILYQFYEGDSVVSDRNGVCFPGKSVYGAERDGDELKAGFLTEAFDWQEDRNPKIPYEDSIAYLLHVRGFTQHSSSKVAHKGTFKGVVEKIPYLKEIGVTCVELQPAYEFQEIPSKEERIKSLPYMATVEDLDALAAPKLNYWGYKTGYYYAPKVAYAAGDAVSEFKELVREFHKNGMEIIMQFYFTKDVSVMEIPEILRYWVMEYHVDGFRLIGENLPIDCYAADPALADTKLWYYNFNTDIIYNRNQMPKYRNLASYQDDYLYDMRKFLKGDENMVKSVMYQMRHVPDKTGRIHYMSNYYGMTLMDMVSYDRKHNEDNGEDNRDGNDYNCSWNCGEEGSTRKKKVTALRLRQLKNAMCMMMFSQSTPLIFMGDEFGNSQKGNNNPYCQDNGITWLDWKDKERNAELHAFWKQLVEIRKAHPVLHQVREPKIMDYIACGYPDLSYHGENAWRPQTESYSRCIGMMYCGKYAKVNHTEDDCFFYIAMNMHWEKHEFALPKLPKGLKWQVLLNTDDTSKPSLEKDDAADGSGSEIQETEMKISEIRSLVSDRSIVIFSSVPDEMFTDTVKGKKRSTAKKAEAGNNGKAKTASDYGDRTAF